ncbi:MAG TPA: glycosyltransferase family 2 protein [Bacteroidales bacterium]|nr:glycosyltransferase family 2 protein [Bacteroidales bacterium]
MKKLSVLIPVHNNLAYTKTCIEKLMAESVEGRFSNMSLSLVVIDDGSTDGTRTWLVNNHSGVTVLDGDGNLWWSGGINAGARYAIEVQKADYVLLWNNDIVADTDYFTELDRLVPLLGDHIIAGSKIYRKGEDNILWSYGGAFNPRTGSKYMYGYNKADGDDFQKPGNADWLPGMGTLIPAKVIETIGYWDEKNFPQYHGDSDFTYRARLAGFGIKVYPGLKIWNDTTNTGLSHQGSLRVLIRLLSDIKSNYNLKKNILFYRKYATSIFAYRFLFMAYFMLFGGFFKWKILSALGIRKPR